MTFSSPLTNLENKQLSLRFFFDLFSFILIRIDAVFTTIFIFLCGNHVFFLKCLVFCVKMSKIKKKKLF